MVHIIDFVALILCLIMRPIGLHLRYAYCVDIDCIPYTDIDIDYRVACILHFRVCIGNQNHNCTWAAIPLFVRTQIFLKLGVV